jgi:hypothetical protein
MMKQGVRIPHRLVTLLCFFTAVSCVANAPIETNSAECDTSDPSASCSTADDGSFVLPQGTLRWTLAREFDAVVENPSAVATGVATDGSDLIGVAGLGEAVLLDRDGHEVSHYSFAGQARAVAVSGTNVFVATDTDVIAFSGHRDMISPWASLGNQAIITSLAVWDNSVYVADAGNGIVMQYDMDGMLRSIIGSPEHFLIPSPYFDIAVDDTGQLYVTNPGRLHVELRRTDGALEPVLGRSSLDLDGFAGCCNPAQIAVSPDGRIATSEKGRVVVKESDPASGEVTVALIPSCVPETTTAPDIAYLGDSLVILIQGRATIRIYDPPGVVQ